MPPLPSRLTDLELEIMQIVWDARPDPLTVRDVAERHQAAGRKPLAYTTIQTMMNILTKKGVLEVGPGPGRAHHYRALLTRDDATASMTRDFVERLFGGSPEPLVARLLEEGSFSRETLEELRALIETQLEDERPEEGR